MSRRLIPVAAMLLFLAAPSHCIPAEPSKVASTRSTTEPLTGYARENAAVRRTVNELISESARFYRDTEAVHARGTLVTAERYPRRGEETESSRVELWFRAPDRIRVDITGKDDHRSFIADGTTVTEIWHTERRYSRRAQPPDLAAFVEMEWPGLTYDDESYALSESFIGPLLLTRDPEAHIRANVVDYILEGTETVAGRRCIRLKFVQENPDCVFNHWVDAETGAYMRTSVHDGYDSDFEVTGRYQNAVFGSMRAMTLDELSTSPDRVADKVFSVKIPRGYKEGVPGEEDLPVGDDPVPDKPAHGFSLGGMLRHAAAASAGESTLTVTRLFGAVSLGTGWWGPKTDVAEFQLLGSGSPNDLFVTADTFDDQIVLLDSTGWTERELRLPGEDAYLVPVRDPGARLFIADPDHETLSAWDSTGSVEWTTPLGGAPDFMEVIRNDDGKPAGYLVGTDKALLRLGIDGKILHTSLTNHDLATAVLVPAGPWAGTYAVTSDEWIAEYAADGSFKRRCSELYSILALACDARHPEAPLVTVGVSEDDDAVLISRMTPDGSVAATGSVPKVETDWHIIGLYPCRTALSSDSRPAACWLVVLSDGTLVLFRDDLTPAARVRLAGRGSAVPAQERMLVQAALVADTDNNGSDEIFLSVKGGIIRADWVPAAPRK